MLQQLAKFLLWVSVLAWSFWLGGLIYEMVVLMPLWSGDLPQSAIEWNSRPNFIVNPTRFYLPVALTCVVSTLLAFILGGKADGKLRWRGISATASMSALVFTIIYFFPRNDILFRSQNIGLSGTAISDAAYQWIAANWIRFGIMVVGYFAALWAFRVSHSIGFSRLADTIVVDNETVH